MPLIWLAVADVHTRVQQRGPATVAPLPLFSYLMHVDRLGCIYHAAARFGLGDARLPASVACVRNVARACVLLRVLTSCPSACMYIRTCVHARHGAARRGAARSRGPVSRVDNGGRHAEMRAATVLRLCLRSVARATCATPSAFPLRLIAKQRNAQVIFSKSSRPFNNCRSSVVPLRFFSFSSLIIITHRKILTIYQ